MSAGTTTPVKLAERLGRVHVGLREDLDTTRHVFRGEPSYIVRDPLTFRTHRFDVANYEILVSIDASRPLCDVFDDLVRRGKLTPDDEESFYEFVLSLHRAGCLNLPIADGKLLYRRYQARNSARRRQKAFSFVYVQIPLWNPDAFLDKTVHLVRPLFSGWFAVLWVALMVLGGYVVVQRWTDLVAPLGGVLAEANLPLMWLTLVALKIAHEFGHAYACKHYGVHVPEMGMYLVVGTPCAYIDASAAWSLAKRRQRLVVGLAGMYVESLIALAALFVWAATGPSTLNAVAYNVMLLASVVTILFNMNPLMRYDGYYVLSDLLEVPNLGQRAAHYLSYLAKRFLLGLNHHPRGMQTRPRALLLAYGIAAPLYKIFILLLIAALLASKLFVVGLLLGVVYLLFVVGGALVKLVRYLWFAAETAPVRGRAVAWSGAALLGIPILLAAVPVRSGVRAPGAVRAAQETVVRAETPGFLQAVRVQPGEHVAADALLAELDNDVLRGALTEALVRLQGATVRRDAYQIDQPAKAREEHEHVLAVGEEVSRRREQVAALTIRTPAGGRVVECVDPRETGRFVAAGTALARVVAGAWRVEVLLSEDDMSAAQPEIGQAVEFRAATTPGVVRPGTIQSIAPAGDRRVSHLSLTHAAGGAIVVAPESGEARQPYFVVTIALDAPQNQGLRSGTTGFVRLRAIHEPLGRHLYRRVTRFMDGLRQG